MAVELSKLYERLALLADAWLKLNLIESDALAVGNQINELVRVLGTDTMNLKGSMVRSIADDELDVIRSGLMNETSQVMHQIKEASPGAPIPCAGCKYKRSIIDALLEQRRKAREQLAVMGIEEPDFPRAVANLKRILATL